MINFFKRTIAIPQDHGSWVFLLSPLAIGLFAAPGFNLASLGVVIGALMAFLIRQPVTVAVKAISGRRPETDLPAAQFWVATYGLIGLLAVGLLFQQEMFSMLWLAVPAAPVFAWHLWLVSKREERRQAAVEVIATGVLALAAPAALWAGAGGYRPAGWLLWLLAWLQSSGSILHAYMRLEQREWNALPNLKDRFQHGRLALGSTTVNLIISLVLVLFNGMPAGVSLAFLLQWGETLWGILRPAIGVKPTAIGIRQLIVSILFTLLFIIFWR